MLARVRCVHSENVDSECVTDVDVLSAHALDYCECCDHVLVVPGALRLHACGDSQPHEMGYTDAVSWIEFGYQLHRR